MFNKLLVVAAVLVSIAAAPAHAGVGLNDFRLNGFTLNGFTLNGFTLNGITTNGFTLNGWPLNGAINVGGHHGVGLNGKVLAIEF